jgi:hypothetical protein
MLMSASKLREQMLFDTSTCRVVQAWAHADNSGARTLVGHCFLCCFEIPQKVLLALYISSYLVLAFTLLCDKHALNL